MIVLPKKRSFARWYKLIRKPYSLLRALEYEAIEGLYLVGKVLDIGGGAGVDYHHLLRVTGTIETINIDKQREPTYLLDLNQPLPFADETFDHVISFNTFEHIKNDELAISEALRVLKKGGTFHFIVPFCHRVHGSPSDYHRHTAHWWMQNMIKLGSSACRIEPLVWDPRSSAYALLGRKIDFTERILMLWAMFDIGSWTRHLTSYFPWLYSKLWQRGAVQMSAAERDITVINWAANLALGYYTSGMK